MTLFRRVTLEGTALAALLAFGAAAPAQANYAFSGSGGSGYLNTSDSTEIWHIPAASGAPGWGSPGISYSVTQYTQSQPAYGMVLSFTDPDGDITPGSIAIGNGAGCAGDTTGGTTFCTVSPTDIWKAFQTGPNSVEFLAQNASFDLTTGQYYFVNVLYSGEAPTSFTGEWLTSFTPTIPEPSTTLVLGTGLLVLGAARLRKRS